MPCPYPETISMRYAKPCGFAAWADLGRSTLRCTAGRALVLSRRSQHNKAETVPGRATVASALIANPEGAEARPYKPL